MERTTTFGFTPRLVVGLTILWIGTVSLIDALGFHEVHPLMDVWPAGIILLAIAIALNGGGWVPTLFVGALGIWLLGESLDLFDLDFEDLWPLVLVFFGLRLIVKGAGFRPDTAASKNRTSSFAIFSNRNHMIEGDSFTSGDATAVLGSSTIDLTRARFPEGARIDVFCLAGGVHVIVSPETRVVSDVMPIMAGYEDKRRTHATSTQTLNIRGLCIWGGVEISSAIPEIEGERA